MGQIENHLESSEKHGNDVASFFFAFLGFLW